MTDVFFLRPMIPNVTPEEVKVMGRMAGSCFQMHSVVWHVSYLAKDGGRMVCRYSAPDAESARAALRQLGSDASAVWAGQAFDDAERRRQVTFLAELEFTSGIDTSIVERLRDDPHLTDAYLSNDQRHLLCAFTADDEHAVCGALANVALTPTDVWPCEAVFPS